MAFKKARLDIGNDVHRMAVLVVLASVVYGRRDPGQPKKWSGKKLRRLRSDVDAIKAKHPEESELDCCKRLEKESGKSRYDLKPTTLLRLLQRAKRLDKDAQLLVSLRDDDAVATDLINQLKEHH